MIIKCTGEYCDSFFDCEGKESCPECGADVERSARILAALDVIGLQIVTMNKVTICDEVARMMEVPVTSVGYNEVMDVLRQHKRSSVQEGVCPNCDSTGQIGKGCPTCPGFWFSDPADPGEDCSLMSKHISSPTPNSNTELIVKDHPNQRPGYWWATVLIVAEPTVTAEEVKDTLTNDLMFNLDEDAEHPISVSIDNEGLQPDEGSDENTVCWS